MLKPTHSFSTAEAGIEYACTREDPELFFPEGPGKKRQTEEAKLICNTRCTTKEECLDLALRTNSAFGIWGGLSEDQRSALKRKFARLGSRAM